MNKKGFTLIEMLIVVVLIGTILTIAIPSVLRLVESRSKDQYNIQIKLIDQASNLYQTRYRGEFNSYPDAKCFILDYDTLIAEDLIKKEDIDCSDSKIVFNKQSNKRYKKTYYLKCKDKNGVVFNDSTDTLPQECVTLGSDVVEEENKIASPTITGGNNEWVPTNINISVDNSGIALSDVSYYEYYTSNSGITPKESVAATGTTTNGNLTISDDGTTHIWYRVVDKSGNKSNWSNKQVANIDKATPTNPVITASDGISSGGKHSGSFTLTFGGGNNISGNTYYYGTTSNPTNIATAINITSSDNGKTYYVKSCSGANICSSAVSYKVTY